MAVKISLDEQIKHIEDALRNSKAFVALTKRYVAEGERHKEVLDEAERRVPYWEAALATLKWVQKNRQIIIAAKKDIDK
jgi:hypothetical protein